ncbi:RNA-binding cell elongation regulator Jag/EloR [Ruminococcus sp.]|uniref:RNA-binding cell elongation regulator Jag/EloR n=1 Tax=Ruminococcus sp. TaxID=41978 RepID=UPI0025DC7805|nr:RNA-binding cell elongation regulator Jag/EloR [Ruminococcus sp.]
MKQIFTAPTVEEAKSKAAAEFGADVEKISFTVLEEPKKGFFGKIKGEAKVEAEYEAEIPTQTPTEAPSEKSVKAEEPTVFAETEPEAAPAAVEWSETAQKKADCAKNYILSVIKAMGIEGAEIEVTKLENGALFEITSEEFEGLINKKGDILDSLQYLASLVCNRIDREYFRISTDCGGFRARRKKQLEDLARKIANNVKRSGRSSALEPMNPYERRIIHAAVSEIEGVTSQSKGEEPWRKVIISSTSPRKYDNRGGYKKNGGRRRNNNRRSKGFDITTSFEKDYKKPKPEDTMKDSGLYSKIEF